MVSNRRMVRWSRIGVRGVYRTLPLIGLALAVSCGSPAPQAPPTRPIAPSSVAPPPVSRPAAPAQLGELGPLVIGESDLPGYTRGAPLARASITVFNPACVIVNAARASSSNWGA